VVALWAGLAEEFEEFFDAFSSVTLGEAKGDLLYDLSTIPTFGPPLVPVTTPPACVTALPTRVTCGGQLLPLLLDSITTGVLWDKLRLPHSILLLYRLRRVNKAWHDFVGTTIEWTALEFTKMDNPGYLRFARKWRGRHRYRTRFKRYNIEIGNLNIVLLEPQRFVRGLS
jgi:hypothetical protein